MLNIENHLAAIDSPVRKIQGKVELYNGSTLSNTFLYTDALKSFTVERIGEGKFFGFGICQKTNIKLIDVNRELNITTANTFRNYFGVSGDYKTPYPVFHVTEVNRDENTNELSITAYDALEAAAAHTVSELNLTAPYVIWMVASAAATLLGLSGMRVIGVTEVYDTSYENGANFDGTETIRDVLNAIAEATQTIYYVDADNRLIFKRMDISGAPVIEINKSRYFTLDSKTNRRLSVITHATDLGDNVTASIDATGSTQYVRNNPFWELREDIGTLLNKAIAAVGGFTLNQFNCSWRGNYLLEIGDKIALVTKDNETVISFVLNDTVNYDGTLSESTEWSYAEDNAETASNPSNLGEALKQTFARVDKANKEITILASETTTNSENIANLQVNTESIVATVSNMEANNKESLDTINDNIDILTTQVQAKVSAEDVKLEIQTELENGVTQVTTNTGFTFNDEGLTVEKSDSEMKTKVTEDGMTVYRNDEAVLTANNAGVNAANLHATTFLIIGEYSRFEDYLRNGEKRTGCFWIGN